MAYETEREQNPYGAPTDNPYGAGGYGDWTGQQDQRRQSAYAKVRAAYRRLLNRDASDSEIESHLAGRYDDVAVTRAIQVIETSPEAQQRSTTTTPPAETGTTAPPPPTGPYTRDQRDQLSWNNVGRMEGFEVGSTYGGDLKARNSVKNTFGRIASRYPATPEGLRQVVNDPDFRRAFPNARLIADRTGDKIDFGGVQSDFETGTPVGVVDVGRAFAGDQQREQTAWVWQPVTTSNAAYSATQAAIMGQPDGRYNTAQPEGTPSRVSDAVLNRAEPDAFDPTEQYLQYLQMLLGQQPPAL